MRYSQPVSRCALNHPCLGQLNRHLGLNCGALGCDRFFLGTNYRRLGRLLVGDRHANGGRGLGDVCIRCQLGRQYRLPKIRNVAQERRRELCAHHPQQDVEIVDEKSNRTSYCLGSAVVGHVLEGARCVFHRRQ
ncbi:hypothetical protein D9M71_485010 [compost metagenome]